MTVVVVNRVHLCLCVCARFDVGRTFAGCGGRGLASGAAPCVANSATSKARQAPLGTRGSRPVLPAPAKTAHARMRSMAIALPFRECVPDRSYGR